MKNFTLFRLVENNVTIGAITLNNNVICVTLEPPWKQNERNISCIRVGDYICSKVAKQDTGVSIGKAEFTYEIRNVPERSDIMFHVGNYSRDTAGCILCGKHSDKDTIWDSRLGFFDFIEATEGDKTFLLTIKDVK